MQEVTKRIAIIYDKHLTDHKCHRKHPEKPERVRAIIKRLNEHNYLTHPSIRYIDTISRLSTNPELQLAHTAEYVKHIQSLWPKETNRIDMTILDSYYNEKTEEVSRMAVGGVLQGVDMLMERKEVQEVFAVVRPPGHHSGAKNTISGFCVYNNVAIAARYLIEKHKLKRVMVLDWDVHHGNGTQQLLMNQPNALFISIHRYDYATFYPESQFGNYTNIGSGVSQGMHVNIPLNYVDKSFKEYSFQPPGDNEYIYMYHRVIEPIIRSYKPEFILISSGFDAARHDPLGGFSITPNGYYYLARKLKELVVELAIKQQKDNKLVNNKQIRVKPIPLMFVLEGGYNVVATSDAATAVIRALVSNQQFPEKQFFEEPVSFKDIPNQCFIEPPIHQQFDEIIEHHTKTWEVLKSDDLVKYTKLIKKNNHQKFGKHQDHQNKDQDQGQKIGDQEEGADETQNDDVPKNKNKKDSSTAQKHPKERNEMRTLLAQQIVLGMEIAHVEPKYHSHSQPKEQEVSKNKQLGQTEHQQQIAQQKHSKQDSDR